MPAPFEQQPTPSETAVSAATQVASNDKGDELQAARLGRSPSSANIEQQLSHDQQAWAPSAATQLGRSRVDLPPPSPRSPSPLKAELEAATAQLRAATQQVGREMGLGIGRGRSARIAHHPPAQRESEVGRGWSDPHRGLGGLLALRLRKLGTGRPEWALVQKPPLVSDPARFTRTKEIEALWKQRRRTEIGANGTKRDAGGR
jgi:hypothetical protein